MKYQQDETFRVGVSAHCPSHGMCNGYPHKYLHEHVRLAAELGVKLYRVDLGGPDDEAWFDELVPALEEKGIALMVNVGTNLEYVRKIAERYRGRIAYYQMRNEIDCECIKKNGPNGAGDGKVLSDYDIPLLDKAVADVKGISAVLREADPAAKTVVNGTWVHYGMIQYLLDHGADFDVLGWDWYSNMDHYGIDLLLEELQRFGKDIIFCETNIWPLTHEEPDRAPWIAALLEKLYHHPSGRVRGVVIYEFLDEPRHPVKREGTFGIVRVENDGKPVGVKDAYKMLQSVLL